MRTIFILLIGSILFLSAHSDASDATPTISDEQGCPAIKPDEYKIPMCLVKSDFPGRSQYLLEEYEFLVGFAKSYISIIPETKTLVFVPGQSY